MRSDDHLHRSKRKIKRRVVCPRKISWSDRNSFDRVSDAAETEPINIFVYTYTSRIISAPKIARQNRIGGSAYGFRKIRRALARRSAGGGDWYPGRRSERGEGICLLVTIRGQVIIQYSGARRENG